MCHAIAGECKKILINDKTSIIEIETKPFMFQMKIPKETDLINVKNDILFFSKITNF